jgi:hypothetical protein
LFKKLKFWSASMKRAGSVSGTNATPNAAGRPLTSSVLFGLVLLAALAFPGGCNNYNLSLENFFSGSGSLSLSGGDDIAGGIDFEDFGPVPPDSIIRLTAGNETEWRNDLLTIQNGGNNKNYVITLTDDFPLAITPFPYPFGSSTTGVTVSLRGAKTISLNTTGNLLKLAVNQTLILRDANLQGYSSNNTPLVQLVTPSTFFMRSGTIFGNKAGNGSGVYVDGGNAKFTMSGGTIHHNTATTFGGGGVYVNNGGSFTMNGGTISDNTAVPYGDGGGVYVDAAGGSFTMNSGTISDNTAGNNGGGVYFSAGGTFTITMYSGTIHNNTAAMDGGGVYVLNSNFTMIDGTISDNTATGGSSTGGGVYFSSGSVFIMSGGIISGNDSITMGGGVYFSSSAGSFTMSGGTISGNDTSNGGGVYVISTSGTFNKSGSSVIYGDSPATTTTAQTAGPNANTATSTINISQNGHAVLYFNGTNYFYRNADLGAGAGITADTGVTTSLLGAFEGYR